MATKIPLLVVSDSPRLQTGLARIARDLVNGLKELPEFQLAQAGIEQGDGPSWQTWPYYVMPPEAQDDWGATLLPKIWAYYYGDQPGILFTVWDPARCFPVSDLKGPWTLWGYFPIDSYNHPHRLTGQSACAVGKYERVIAYTEFGREILSTASRAPVAHLPHGIGLDLFCPGTDEADPPAPLIGVVATNQPRKDLALAFASVAELRRRGHKLKIWVHTDVGVRAWSVAGLAEDFGLYTHTELTLEGLTDDQLVAAYRRCLVTFGPGLGEGFGYPLAESLACGVPCVHGDFGGGAELIPMTAWRVPVRAMRIEGAHHYYRPVFDPIDVANALERAIRWRQEEPTIVREYCRGAVAQLSWQSLWPRWRDWFLEGVEELR